MTDGVCSLAATLARGLLPQKVENPYRETKPAETFLKNVGAFLLNNFFSFLIFLHHDLDPYSTEIYRLFNLFAINNSHKNYKSFQFIYAVKILILSGLRLRKYHGETTEKIQVALNLGIFKFLSKQNRFLISWK